MPRLVYLTSALRELAKISGDIEDASQSREVATNFIDKLTDYREHLVKLPGCWTTHGTNFVPNIAALHLATT